MKKFFFILLSFTFLWVKAQYFSNIKNSEMLHYRIHYGFLNAGTATLTTNKTNFQGTPHWHVKGIGQSTGAVRAFFKVDDIYESYINSQTGTPSYYVRNVKEGGYTQHLHVSFNHNNQTAIIWDKEKPTQPAQVKKTIKGIQDMLSAFYQLRGLKSSQLKIGSVHKMNVWIDDEMFAFQLRVDGTENIKTKFGVINCLKITPMVMSGRVFKAKEGVTMWISNDANLIPVAIRAQLVVGSLKASLDNYKNILHPFSFNKTK